MQLNPQGIPLGNHISKTVTDATKSLIEGFTHPIALHFAASTGALRHPVSEIPVRKAEHLQNRYGGGVL